LAQFKLIVSDRKTSKSEVHELKDSNAQIFVGHRIGDTFDASTAGVNGKLKITGGSDRAGFPMRPDVLGGGKRYVLLTEGVGFRKSLEGEKRRKLVRGNTITDEIYQINAIRVE
jgi:small subunit ribosomal protein S6e